MRPIVSIAVCLVLASSAAAQPFDARPRYDGWGKLDVEPCTGSCQLQGLEELASRTGPKPFEEFKPGSFARFGRVIFRDLRTGAPVWRISDEPFAQESHRYADYSSWNADGSLFAVQGVITQRKKLLSGDLGAEIQPPKGRICYAARDLWDTKQPAVFYGWESGGLVKGDTLTGEMRVLIPREKFEPMLAEWPTKPYVSLYGVTRDGRWILGSAGGSQDEGKSFFAARTDGGELRIARLPAGGGGIHHVGVLRNDHPKVLLGVQERQGGRAKTKTMTTYDFDTGEWRPTADYSHAGIGPDQQVATAVGLDDDVANGHWGFVVFDLKTDPPTRTVCARAANWNDGHPTWCHEDPDWVFASYSTRAGPGYDVFQIRTDGSRTARRLCATGTRSPQFTVYSAYAFAASSPDGTKVQFMSNMLGSVDEYLVVAREPQPPRLLGPEIRDGKVVLKWTPPRFAKEIKGYVVYERTESGKGKRLLTETPVPATRIELPAPEAGGTSCYAVASVEQSGIESTWSNEAWLGPAPADARIFLEAEGGEMTLPARPALAPATCSDGHYAWQTKDREEGSIRLKFDIPHDGNYFFIGRVSGNIPATPWMLSVDGGRKAALTRDVPEAAWEWASWPEGAEMKKGIHEIELSTSHRGAALDVVMVTTDPAWRPARFGTADEEAPSKVEKIETTRARTYDIAVSWTPVRDADTHHYNVYSSRDGRTKVEQRCLIASPSAPPFLDWGLKPDTEYSYVVTAVDRRGNESAPSPLVKARTQPLERETSFALNADALAFAAPAAKGEVKGRPCVILPADREAEATATFDVANPGEYMIWAEVIPAAGTTTIDPILDGKILGQWIVYYDQSDLYGGVSKDSDWVWCPVVVRPMEQQGRFALGSGKHQLTFRARGVGISRLLISNNLSLRPEGKLNTLFLY